jgi:hypothetical protein
MFAERPVGYVHFWPNGETGYVAPLGLKGQPNLYRVGLSLQAPGHLIRLSYVLSLGGSGFAAQAPYLCLFNAGREITVVDLATGTVRAIPIPFFPDGVLAG